MDFGEISSLIWPSDAKRIRIFTVLLKTIKHNVNQLELEKIVLLTRGFYYCLKIF